MSTKGKVFSFWWAALLGVFLLGGGLYNICTMDARAHGLSKQGGGVSGLIPEAGLDINNAPIGNAALSYNSDIGKLEWRTSELFLPNAVTTLIGTYVSGNVESLKQINFTDYIVNEVTGVPGFNVRVDFTGVGSFNKLQYQTYYQGTTSHTVNVQMYNWGTSSWVTVGSFVGQSTYAYQSLDITNSAPYIDGSGNIQVRFYHITAGNSSHTLNFDYCVLRNDIAGAGGITEHGNLGGLKDVTAHPQYPNRTALNGGLSRKANLDGGNTMTGPQLVSVTDPLVNAIDASAFSGDGVYGHSTNGVGVAGLSTSAQGVNGFSNSNYGVKGASLSSYGGHFSSTGTGEGLLVENGGKFYGNYATYGNQTVTGDVICRFNAGSNLYAACSFNGTTTIQSGALRQVPFLDKNQDGGWVHTDAWPAFKGESSINRTASYIKIRRTGTYEIKAKTNFGSNSNGYRQINIGKNSANNWGVARFPAVPGVPSTCATTEIWTLNEGDYISMWVLQNSGSEVTANFPALTVIYKGNQ